MNLEGSKQAHLSPPPIQKLQAQLFKAFEGKTKKTSYLRCCQPFELHQMVHFCGDI